MWGGDFNRSTDDFQEQQVRQGHYYVVAPSDQSTCMGGRIDYFVTNGAMEHVVGRGVTIPGKVRPHVPVLMRVKYRPHLTKVCGLARMAHNFPRG